MNKAAIDIFNEITASKNSDEMDAALASIKKLPKDDQLHIATALEANLRMTADRISDQDLENMKALFADDKNTQATESKKDRLAGQVCGMASIFNKVAEIKGAQSSPFTKAVVALYQELDANAKFEPAEIIQVLKTASNKTSRTNPKAA